MIQKIKVLHVIDSLAVGGAERLLINLANSLDYDRFECYVCCLNVTPDQALQSELTNLSAPPFVIGSKRFYDPRAALALARYIREKQIDIVHTQLTRGDIIGRIVGRLTGRMVVSTLQNIPHQYDRLRADRRWLLRLTARFCTTRLTAVSKQVTEMFIKEWGIPRRRISTIYNAVPIEQFLSIPARRIPKSADDGPVITTLGRLTRQKAQHLLISAAKIVLEQRPDARFMIVGEGYLLDTLKAQAEALGIADRVIFTGVRRDVANVLAESDIFVLSSLWEGLPLSAGEAMAAARPAVLTDVGGNSELVESGVQGFIVPPENIEALAEALLTLINNPEQRIAMGEAARMRVRQDFNIHTITAQYEELYETMLHESHRLGRRKQVRIKPS